MLTGFEKIIEERIRVARMKGEFKNLPGSGEPIVYENDGHIPEDLRLAYKILKNSGYLPPEIEERKEVKKLEDLIACTTDEHERLKQMKKLNVLLMKVDARRPFSSNISSQNEYYRKVVEKITVHSKTVKKDSK